MTNVNEAPVFSETTEALKISENPDDPEKEPPSAAKYLYLLNRGVGKPAANLPLTPNLDVGIPVVAVDDDNTFTILDYTGAGYSRGPYGALVRPIQLIDGLTYELSGADAAAFHIVPATGQILTLEKLDYEPKNEYDVTVTATDPWGAYGMIDLTIEVTDVDEQPVPKILRISGESSHAYEENGTDALGEYTVAAGGGATVGRWSLDGPDASSFRLEGTGDSRMLKFASAPDYENPRALRRVTNTNTYEVTLKVTDPSEQRYRRHLRSHGVSDRRGRTRYAERIDRRQRRRGRHGCPGHLHAHGRPRRLRIFTGVWKAMTPASSRSTQ